jgi:hypothetical protein
MSRPLFSECKLKIKADASYSPGALLYGICEIFHNHLEPEQPDRIVLRPGFSLRIPCTLGLKLGFSEAREVISKASGADMYWHDKSSLGYYLNGSNHGCPTIVGTLEQVKNALNLFPEELIAANWDRMSDKNVECKRCSLRITAPSTATLDRLCKAVQACRDNPNTLGVDFRTKAFYAVKTVSDMKLLLDDLTKDTSGQTGTTMTLVGLHQPKDVF